MDFSGLGHLPGNGNGNQGREVKGMGMGYTIDQKGTSRIEDGNQKGACGKSWELEWEKREFRVFVLGSIASLFCLNNLFY